MRLLRTIAACGFGLCACVDPGSGDTTASTSEPEVVPLEIHDVAVTPLAHTHLAVTVRFSTSVPCESAVEVHDDDDARVFIVPGAASPATEHRVDVLGLRPESSFRLIARARDDAGREVAAEAIEHVPGPLPPDFPPFAVLGEATSAPAGVADASAPSWTLFGVTRWRDGQLDFEWGLLLALDRRGRVVWYQRILDGGGDVRLTADGELWYGAADTEVHRTDFLGNERGMWRASEITPAVDSLHHESLETPEGDLLSLSTKLRAVDGFDDGQGGTVSYDLVGDVVVQVARDGALIASWSLFDVLPASDHHRIRPGFHDSFWDGFYATAAPGGTKDWSHGNAIARDEARGLYLVSAHNLDWIVALDPAAAPEHALAWRLGEGGDFTLTEGEWFYHQHAPEVQSNGRLLIYDNGVARPGTGLGPGDDPPYTRVVEYALDEEAMRATQTWEWIADPPRFALFVGDADRLANGNVLVTDGGLWSEQVDDLGVTTYTLYSILEEIAPQSGETVFRVQVGGPANATSYTVYRAQRVLAPHGDAPPDW